VQQDAKNSLLLLGRDYGEYGLLHTAQVGSRAAVAISVGSDVDSPSLQFKHDPLVKNEDALLVVESSDRVGFAVADAHFGPESSHVLLEQIYAGLTIEIPQTPAKLRSVIESVGEGCRPKTLSETTFVVVIYDRKTSEGFGVSVGDSTVMAVSRNGSTRVLNARNQRYVAASNISTSKGLAAFEFKTAVNDLLLAFTDGVNECHYRHSATSIKEADIAQIARDTSFDSLNLVHNLGELALRGVRSNPGGQDNIAIVAVAV